MFSMNNNPTLAECHFCDIIKHYPHTIHRIFEMFICRRCEYIYKKYNMNIMKCRILCDSCHTPDQLGVSIPTRVKRRGIVDGCVFIHTTCIECCKIKLNRSNNISSTYPNKYDEMPRMVHVYDLV